MGSEIIHYAPGRQPEGGKEVHAGAPESLGGPFVAGVQQVVAAFAMIELTVAVESFRKRNRPAGRIPGKTRGQKVLEGLEPRFRDAGLQHLASRKLGLGIARYRNDMQDGALRPEYRLQSQSRCRFTGLVERFVSPADFIVRHSPEAALELRNDVIQMAGGNNEPGVPTVARDKQAIRINRFSLSLRLDHVGLARAGGQNERQ
jgi:hypothetical protein